MAWLVSLCDQPTVGQRSKEEAMAIQWTKLELTWIGKENRPRLEPRIPLEDPEKSHHAARRDILDNRLISGTTGWR